MPDISIQLHALPEELVQFTQDCMGLYNLHVAAMRYRPFEVVALDSDALSSLLNGLPDHRRLSLSIEQLCLQVDNELAFQKANPDSLRLDIPRKHANGLEEAWLCARTDNLAAFQIWKKIAQRLRRMTHAGVTAVNRNTGVAVTYKSARYSDGAKRLEELGVPMLPAQGEKGPLLRLGADRHQ